MKKHFSFKCYMFLILMLAALANAESPKTSSTRLSGHTPTQALYSAKFLNQLDGATEVPLTLVLPLRNKEALEKLLERIYNPSDKEHYGKYLTPEEFLERFGPTQEDYDHVVAYAKSLGLIITGTHSNRMLLNVSGSAACLESAFNLRLHQYQKPNGRIFHAPDNEPEVSVSMANRIHSILGLDNHAVRRTYKRQKEMEKGLLTSNAASHVRLSGPRGGLSPNDLLIAYNLNGVSANGSNQVIALFELGGYQESDINEYTRYFGLPPAKLTNVLVNGGSGGGIDAEVTLDIELALALAPESEIYVYEGPNTDQGVLNTYNRIATDNIAKQVSTSWGLGESFLTRSFLQAEYAIFLQMAAHGQTIYAAAGDNGAYDEYPYNSSLIVDDPSSQPYVVGVGGTRLTVNGGSGAYEGESVWNDGLGNGAGGGGISSFWPIPSWQKNVSTVASKTHRNVPDVSLNADTNTGYSIYHDGQWVVYGGTSCAAPLWAAFTARVNEERRARMQSTLGFANPLLYSIGTGTSYMENFHDVIFGNNLHYSARTGYDNASGWGSFNGANLFLSLTSSLPYLSPVLTVSMSPSNSFLRGGKGTYKIIVQNQGSGPTSDAVTVVLALPKGVTCQSLKGGGWTCDSSRLTCIRSDALGASSSYPTITLTVNVARKATTPVIATATVSGGGALSNTVTSQIALVR